MSSDTTPTGKPRILGRCGNCDGLVWTDQEFVRWEGFVLIHSDCWGGDEPTHTESDQSGGASA